VEQSWERCYPATESYTAPSLPKMLRISCYAIIDSKIYVPNNMKGVSEYKPSSNRVQTDIRYRGHQARLIHGKLLATDTKDGSIGCHPSWGIDLDLLPAGVVRGKEPSGENLLT
jgi:hypothetical protein